MPQNDNFLNNNNHLKFAIELSAQPSRAALTQHFIAILNNIYQPQAIRLYRPEQSQTMTPKRDQDLASIRIFNYLAPSDQPATPLHEIPGASACASEDKVVVSPGNGYTTSYFPIHGCGGICEILAIDHPSPRLTGTELLGSLLKLFENLLGIFNLAERDSLTNLFNRKAFDKTIAQVHNEERQRYLTRSDQHCIYLAMIDIDHFKKINDQLGHLYGDEILIEFARLLEQSLRRQDWIFRYGGEEFAAIIEDISPNHIEIVLNRFRETVAQHTFAFSREVTVSIGCARIEPGGASPTTIDKADKALYYSKEHGRNRISVYETLLENGCVLEAPLSETDITFF
jgi:diguanylate cyclase (GGDEF)-like protein